MWSKVPEVWNVMVEDISIGNGGGTEFLYVGRKIFDQIKKISVDATFWFLIENAIE
jgi:hypothetical protein